MRGAAGLVAAPRVTVIRDPGHEPDQDRAAPAASGGYEVSPVAPLIGTDDPVAAWDAPASSHAAPFWCPCPAFTKKTPRHAELNDLREPVQPRNATHLAHQFGDLNLQVAEPGLTEC